MNLKRATAVLLLGGAIGVSGVGPAFADQAYPAPGFPSEHASCVGSSSDFQTHYAGEEDTFPVITHGTMGPTASGAATSLPPGSVGEFQSALARTSGPIWVCVP